jgi:hypothetical protein
VAGRWIYLYRAIDQNGQVVDVMLSARRDLAAARRLFTRALRAGTVPAEVAFVQNFRRGHYEIATDIPARHRLHEAFHQLTVAI